MIGDIMIQIYGKHLERWERFKTLFNVAESKNTEMNLRFVLLTNSYKVGQIDQTNFEDLRSQIRAANDSYFRLKTAKDAVEANKAFIRPFEAYADFDIVVPSEENIGFGLIPLIIGAGIAISVLISATIMTTKICDTVETQAIADLRTEQLKAEQAYSKADPATKQRWDDFKKANKPLMEEINRLSEKNGTGGLGFGGMVQNIGFVLVAGLAVFLALKIFGGDRK